MAGLRGEPAANAPMAPTPVVRRPTVRTAVRVWGERLGIILIALGIVGLIQPWVQDFFTNGFTVLLAGTLVFIVASHL